MAEHDPIFEELLPALSLGALEGEELAKLEAHLAAGCELCERELREWSRQTEALAESVPAVEPSEHLRARVLAGLEPRGRRPEATRFGTHWQGLAAAAALALLVWSGWGQLELRRQVERLTAVAATNDLRLRRVSDELERARGQLRQASLAARIAAAPGMRAVALAGLEGAPRASAQALVDPAQGRAVFYASNLAPPPAGKTYQLWFIEGGVPVSGGTFDPDPEGGVSLIVDRVAPPQSIQAWAVTVEPAGGVPQPTGEMVLKG